MFGSNIIDVAIALVFIYFLLSVIASHVNELIASILSWRARYLEAGIQKMLNEPGLAMKVMNHPIIQSLAQGQKPSYIPAATFAMALLDTLGPAALRNPTVQSAGLDAVRAQVVALPADSSRDALLVMIDSAKDDPDKLRALIEGWFNAAMDRVGSVYKRHMQLVTLLVALLITLLFGADTIALADALYKEPALRAAIGGTVQAGVTQPASAQAVTQTLSQFNLPLGWNTPLPDTLVGWLQKIIGFVFTTLAVSLGAPFWFDILKNFTTPRATGAATK